MLKFIKFLKEMVLMFQFTKDSAVVRDAWVPLILAGKRTLAEVPTAFNLKVAVEAALAEIAAPATSEEK